MKRGFSLVELSIVLVILGLLTGGILAGQSLIRASELRSITSDSQKFKAMGHTFRDKYFAWPGDMNNATKFWGTADVPASCGTSLNAGTCDGNGDGRVTASLGATTQESFRSWQHLANAGLIEGSYTGVANAVSPIQTLGVNVPKSKMSNMGYTLYYAGPIVHANWYAIDYGHMLSFGPSGGTHHMGLSLPAEEIWNIDTKLDDGKPGTGVVVTTNNTAQPLCVDSDTAASANYILTNRNACLFVQRNIW